MSNDTRTIDLVVNNLTEEQFENVFSPDPNELWLTPDDTPEQLAQKVDKTTEANKTYGTDAQGNQITYSTPTIPTVNNPTITITQGGVTKGSFTLNQAIGDTIALDAGGGGIGNIDNLTITANADQEIQTVATINANTATGATNPIYDWVGTLAEYNAQSIESLHPAWVCFITDDLSAEAYEAYTKGETLNMFVQKGHQVVEFQEPTAANNYTWYRKYADGWVEQGGILIVPSSGVAITLPVVMANNTYGCLATAILNTIADGVGLQMYGRTTTLFYLRNKNYGSSLQVRATWQVSGMAA